MNRSTISISLILFPICFWPSSPQRRRSGCPNVRSEYCLAQSGHGGNTFLPIAIKSGNHNGSRFFMDRQLCRHNGSDPFFPIHRHPRSQIKNGPGVDYSPGTHRPTTISEDINRKPPIKTPTKWAFIIFSVLRPAVKRRHTTATGMPSPKTSYSRMPKIRQKRIFK